mmetsp:Transcript_62801/g.112000  ORF Transcript_62801/g.112000 Transcript_62801/m.112000 type:complete len:152 (-) Transcript_62801:15-470(-)
MGSCMHHHAILLSHKTGTPPKRVGAIANATTPFTVLAMRSIFCTRCSSKYATIPLHQRIQALACALMASLVDATICIEQKGPVWPGTRQSRKCRWVQSERVPSMCKKRVSIAYSQATLVHSGIKTSTIPPLSNARVGTRCVHGYTLLSIKI